MLSLFNIYLLSSLLVASFFGFILKKFISCFATISGDRKGTVAFMSTKLDP